MVIKEWHCNGCGKDLEGEFPICGFCGATDPYVVRAFRTPPGFKGDKTKLLDVSLNNFTKQYGLSDFSNNLSTAHEKKYAGLDGKPISLNDTWKPASEVVSAPDPGESRADLIKSLTKEAAAPITSKKIVVARGREKQKQAAAR